jgi:DHA2 family methylenomycin A resistance protein-like MFS transporter
MTLTAPRPAAPDARSGLALFGLALGYFMVLLDTTVLTVALPDLARSFHSSVAGLQWAVNGYTVVFAALLLTAGAMVDRFGAYRVFRCGVLAFGVVSLLCVAAPALWTLVVLRGLLGVAGAAILPSSLAVIARLYPVPAERARALGGWAATTGAALAAGPIVGGAMVDLAGWRAVFAINVPIAVLSLALLAGRGIAVPPGRRAIDWRPQVAACAALALLSDAIIAQGPRSAITGPLGAAALAGFAVLERRSATPAIPPAVLRAPGVPVALLAGAAVNFALSGCLFVVTLLLQQSRHLGPLETGLAFLPLTLPTAVNPLLTGRLVARFGPRPPTLGGLALLTAGGLTLGGFDQAPYGVLAIGLALLGFGVSFTLPALVASVVSAAPQGLAGTASGLLNAGRQVGATLGVAVMGALVEAAGLVRGGSEALALGAVLCAICALAAARCFGRRTGGLRGRDDLSS